MGYYTNLTVALFYVGLNQPCSSVKTAEKKEKTVK